MIVINKLTVVDIQYGKAAVYTVGKNGLQSIQYIGNSTHRITYEDKTILFIRTKDFLSEGVEEKRT
jgi:hypothetical protein